MLHTVVSRPDLADPAFAARWSAMAVGASAFLGWEWTGCLAAERFPDPVLIEAHDGDGVVGMALFNRRRGRLGTALHLHESGDPALDAVFIEHNGVLARDGQAVAACILKAARGLASRVVLSGIDADTLLVARAGGMAGPLLSRAAPFRVLGPDLLAGLSRNSRAQVRRSDRSYGTVRVERAGTAAVALDWLERMVPLHRATWAARGVESAFLAAPVQRFHRALLERGVPTGCVAMLRVSGEARVVGYLLNLVGGGAMLAYQSGFDYPAVGGAAVGGAAGAHGKPGLTSHVAAMGFARDAGLGVYDFLAGDSRFKRSLATGVRPLHWTDVRRPVSLAGAEALLRQVLRR